MKRLTISLILLFLIGTFSAFGQTVLTCDTLKESFPLLPANLPTQINCIDNFGQKQGWWVLYTGEILRKYSYGQYIDDKKIYKWEYVSIEGDVIRVYKTVNYLDNDSVSLTTSGQRIIINYNKDSSLVQAIITEPYTILIECNKDNASKELNCFMTYEGITLSTFSYDRFDFELGKAEMGVYSRQIQTIKNGNR